MQPRAYLELFARGGREGWTSWGHEADIDPREQPEQADYLRSKVLGARKAGIPLNAQAVFVRADSNSASLEDEFTCRNIPFATFAGLKFLEAARFKDLLAILRFADDGLLPGAATSARDRAVDSRIISPP